MVLASFPQIYQTSLMWRKLLFFSLLYFIQGAALAYVMNFQKPFLSEKGVSLSALGLFTSLLLVPFILKVGLGFVSDRFPLGKYGARKPYMILSLTLFAACFFGLATIDPGRDFLAFAVVMWLASFGLAWFDCCADGWAVDVCEDHEQSAVQAAMIAGKSLGLVLMSAIFGYIAFRFGFALIFTIIGGLALLVVAVVALVPHRRPEMQVEELVHDWRGLLRSHYVSFAFFAITYAVSSFGADGLMTLFLSQERALNSMQIGFYGMWRGGGALAGAVVYAFVRRSVGLRFSQYLGLILLALGCLVPLFSGPFEIAGLIWGLCWGFQETAFVTLAMRFSEGRWAATLFATAMIFSNIGNSIGEAFGSPLIGSLGFQGVFILFAAVALATAAFLPQALKPFAKGA